MTSPLLSTPADTQRERTPQPTSVELRLVWDNVVRWNDLYRSPRSLPEASTDPVDGRAGEEVRPTAAVSEHNLLRALSAETRIRILLLLERCEHNVGEIALACNVEQPTASRHLSVLKDADLVTSHRRGQSVRYRLTRDGLSRSLVSIFAKFRDCRSLMHT